MPRGYLTRGRAPRSDHYTLAMPPAATPEFRIGHGYDLHRLDRLAPEGRGRPLILGGVRIPSSGDRPETGPVAHSDGDALLHAITDAVLGALGLPDIGQLFPDTDPRHAGQDSKRFLAEAMRRAEQAGWGVANLDATVILERPRLGPHKEAIRTCLAGLLGVTPELVNIKGKTHEGVDTVGQGLAIEAHAVVLLSRLRP